MYLQSLSCSLCYIFIHAFRDSTFSIIKMISEFQCLPTYSSELIFDTCDLIFIIHACDLDLLGIFKIGSIILNFFFYFLFC